MARHLMQGEPLYILFDEDGESVFDSQNRPRMYKSVEAFERAFPRGTVGARLEKYIPSQQWISVKDRLPGTQHIMLVCTKNRNGVPKIAMAYYHDGFGWCGSGGRWGNVTHWMPLPEPPKGE